MSSNWITYYCLLCSVSLLLSCRSDCFEPPGSGDFQQFNLSNTPVRAARRLEERSRERRRGRAARREGSTGPDRLLRGRERERSASRRRSARGRRPESDAALEICKKKLCITY